jgi:ribosomal protein S25
MVKNTRFSLLIQSRENYYNSRGINSSEGAHMTVAFAPRTDILLSEALLRKAVQRFKSIPIMTRAQLHVVMVVPSPVAGAIIRTLLEKGQLKFVNKRLGDSGRRSRLYYLPENESKLQEFLADD